MNRIANHWTVAATTLLFLTVGATALAAEGSADEQEQNKKVVMRTVELMNSKAYDQLGEVMAQDYVRHSQATPEAVVENLDGFVAMLQQWDGSFTEIVNEVHQLIAEGDLVAIYGTYSGTHSGQMGPFAATNKRMSSDYAGYHRMENGKIAETWVTWDNMAIFGQLGISPCPREARSDD